jgi:hypothetical protein
MIKCIADSSIKRKPLLIIIFPSLLSLPVIGVFLLILEINEFQKNVQDNLSAVATIIANCSTAALLFNDQDLERENLAVINTLPEVQAACLYDANGKVFTELLKVEQNIWSCPASIAGYITQFIDTHLFVLQPIMVDTEWHGTMFIRANFAATYWHGLFVKNILKDKVNLAMVKCINEVGHVMGKKTIAEFVEDKTIFNLLSELGVDYVQGYGIGKPVLLSELTLIKPFMATSK